MADQYQMGRYRAIAPAPPRPAPPQLLEQPFVNRYAMVLTPGRTHKAPSPSMPSSPGSISTECGTFSDLGSPFGDSPVRPSSPAHPPSRARSPSPSSALSLDSSSALTPILPLDFSSALDSYSNIDVPSSPDSFYSIENDTLPPRPGSPPTFLHTRLPHINAPVFNRLACVLTNHLRQPIRHKLSLHATGIFRDFYDDHEIYRVTIRPSAHEINTMDFEEIEGFHHIEIELVVTKKDEGDHIVYGIEGYATCMDVNNKALVIGEGEGCLGVATVSEFRNGKDVITGVMIDTNVRVMKEDTDYDDDDLIIKREEGEEDVKPFAFADYKRKREGGEEDVKPMKKKRLGKMKLTAKDHWDRLDWIPLVKWYRLLCKRTFNSYGEARDEDDIAEWEERHELVAALRDPEKLIKVLNDGH